VTADPDVDAELGDRLVAAVLADPMCRAILDRMPALGVPQWWLTAGAVFQNAWNAVCSLPPGFGVLDYDVFYFDVDTSWDAEDRVIRRTESALDDVLGDALAGVVGERGARVEVRNQARVHLWYEERFGVPAAPFGSATDGIDAFPSTTCCVALTRDGTDASGPLRLYAPYGLADVFGMRMRPNRRLAPRAVYDDKVRSYQQRWPALTADPW